MGPQTFLTLESSNFMLNKICVDICIGSNSKYVELAKMEESDPKKSREFEKEFQSCLRPCVDSYLKTREYVTRRFGMELNEVQKYNEEVYKDFYT